MVHSNIKKNYLIQWPSIATDSSVKVCYSHISKSLISLWLLVSIKGKVIEQATEGTDEHLKKLAKKYLGIGRYYYRKRSSGMEATTNLVSDF